VTAPSTDLDPFETALLARLRDVVVERADRLPAPAPRRPARTRRRLVAAVVAATAGAVALPGLLASPAYSVNEGNDGRIHVRVNRLDDAAGLRRALAEHGVAADVTFLTEGRQCAEGRYLPVDRRGLMIEVGEDRFAVTLEPGAVRDGETFVVAASVVPLPDGVRAWTDFGVTAGPVAACTPVPARP
jgi:hypothetical protein